MKLLTTFFLFMICINLNASDLQSDTTIYKIRYGIYGDLNYNLHSANFHRLPGIPNCCLSFESGTGIGYTFGALLEYLIDEHFQASIRINTSNLSAKLVRTEATTIIPNGISVPGEFEHILESTITDIGLEPLFGWNVYKGLTVHAGVRISNVITHDYSQMEKISKPENTGTFLDSLGNDTHQRTRNVFSGEIPDASSLQIFGVIGFSYDLPLNKQNTWLLSPEIFYNHDFSNVIKDSIWHMNSLKFGVAIKYAPASEPELIKEFRREENIDTISVPSEEVATAKILVGTASVTNRVAMEDGKQITYELYSRTDTLLTPKKKAPFLTGDIIAYGVDSTNTEIPDPKFKIEEFEFKRLFPLLNYVFFNDNQSQIPNRYVTLDPNKADKFSPDSLYEEGTMGVYYNVLNIIGKRLSQNSAAKLTIVGCNSGLGAEANNLELSRKRAYNVRNYLMKTFGMDSSRLVVKVQNLPDKPSTPANEPEKIQENRRVELYSDDQSITAPLDIERIERKSNPPVLRFKLADSTNTNIASWKVTAQNGSGSEARVFMQQGTGNPPESVDWDLEGNQKIIPKFPEPVVYGLTLTDTQGNTFSTEPKLLPLDILTVKHKRQAKQTDYELEKFSLILFDFDKWDISGANKSLVNLIKTRISKESEIEIVGFTDKTGDADHNQQLSRQRAQSAKSALSRNDAKADGEGENILLYDNDLPEGRFYCRTVEIIIKTPIK